ncbi:MAG: hypothetical protein AAFW64_00105 [Pseudomonadota bacterium]
MKEIGQLLESDGRFEFRASEHSLIVRGDHPEWVMQAASEVLANAAQMQCAGEIEELETLVEFEEATEVEVDAAKYAMKERFEIIPQCIVSMGRLDYKWVATQGREKLREEFGDNIYRRIHDMSLTYNDSLTQNEPGVDMADAPDSHPDNSNVQ